MAVRIRQSCDEQNRAGVLQLMRVRKTSEIHERRPVADWSFSLRFDMISGMGPHEGVGIRIMSAEPLSAPKHEKGANRWRSGRNEMRRN